MPTVGSLFAGIGGFDLGFERAGFEVKWQVEIDPYCQRVLAKHWPDVRRHDDVKTFPPSDPEEWRVDCIIGGFPCQDISQAGRREGIKGERSGLWAEYARVIRVVRPRYVVVENVAALLYRGLGIVLGDLAESGYDAEWDCIPASAVGAPHRRDRIWIVAQPMCSRSGWTLAERKGACNGVQGNSCGDGETRDMADAAFMFSNVREHHAGGGGESSGTIPRPGNSCCHADMADTHIFGRRNQNRSAAISCGDESQDGLSERGDYWSTEPDVGRVAHGVPARVDRLRGLGNAVVPQVAEWIGRRLRTVMES